MSNWGEFQLTCLQVVFEALSLVLPCMEEEQLAFPKLSRTYFQVMAELLEIFPERVLGEAGNSYSVMPMVMHKVLQELPMLSHPIRSLA